jgi:hypothetical protein
MALVAIDSNGKRVKRGQTVTDFRGDTATFQSATRASSLGKSGKVVVKWHATPGDDDTASEYYDKVFGLTVIAEDD